MIYTDKNGNRYDDGQKDDTIELDGYIGQFRVTELSGGQAVARFALGIPKGPNETRWESISVWSNVFDVHRLQKEMHVKVTGRTHIQKFISSDGTTRGITEVIATNIRIL